MNIAHVSWLLSEAGGGIPPVALALAREQAALGHRAEALGVRDPAHPRLPEDVRAECFAAFGPLALGYSPGLTSALRSHDPDLVHLHGLFTYPSRTVTRWSSGRRRPRVIAPHGMLEPWALARSAVKKRIFWWLVEGRNLAGADCLQALTPVEARSMRALGLGNAIAVVPNGVRLPRTVPPRGAFGERFPEASSRRLLLFLGRLHPVKGLPNLLRAWKRVQARAPGAGDWLLVLAGPDPVGHRHELEELARSLELGHRVLFTGPLSGAGKAEAFSAASGFVLPSFTEGFSVALLEALSYGLPVVLTRQTHFDVAAIGTGWVCEPEPVGLASALEELVEAPEATRTRMGEAGRAAVARDYTWSKVAARLTELYAWLLGGGKPPPFVQVPP